MGVREKTQQCTIKHDRTRRAKTDIPFRPSSPTSPPPPPHPPHTPPPPPTHPHHPPTPPPPPLSHRTLLATTSGHYSLIFPPILLAALPSFLCQQCLPPRVTRLPCRLNSHVACRVFHDMQPTHRARNGHAPHTTHPKLQALVYDILLWRKVPESEARSVHAPLSSTDRYAGLTPVAIKVQGF